MRGIMRLIIFLWFFFIGTFFILIYTVNADENSLTERIQGTWCGTCIQKEPCLYEFKNISKDDSCPQSALIFFYNQEKYAEGSFTINSEKNRESESFPLEIIDETTFRITLRSTQEEFEPIFEGQ